ncbi:universal stress protein [Tenacibaculum maritimum]|uniref:UspA domain-containing protein n=1 Tax=Tenacibaculum maritimum NCIMB 2154 TaxID=1349785 RepID=A0A2H1EAC9_9FLAO|nr:universal stress protein [Tenacibaculum maritimum]MCD9561604.1 universal stress protein [Tenacibaculum maritimum]MCD9565375.1 universal stress protein [Tenacibaculum maritimum]MCD9579285.1 universal stress protein [Tenacibaculum maritimum]MCD9582597.1 universal stress protein [Tenacibaculum maritimum]MCD9584337.1 universal stress protein [Tenacibaculum maritimum]
MQQIQKILIGIAFSPNLKANLFEAVRLANMFNAELVGVHVGGKSDKKEKQLKELLQQAPPLKTPIKTIWQSGKPVNTILQICKTENINLLVLGALQQENIYKYYVGSIARELTRKASCSVLLLIKPSIERVSCKHIVVNGLEDKRTEETIKIAFNISKDLGCKRITIVEEISQAELAVKVNDDKSLREATIKKERIKTREDKRVRNILKNINCSDIIVKSQSIFGKRGYSIGHFAKVKRADLLIMNAPTKLGLLDRIFPHDLEYILSELPTDVLIVK